MVEPETREQVRPRDVADRGSPAAGGPSQAVGRVLVEVERTTGPGPVVEFDDRGRPVVRRFRSEGLWLGFDHGSIPETDDGRGRAVAALVALPASTFPGCRVEVDLTGALVAGERAVLLVVLPGTPLPPISLARAAAAMGEGTLLDAEAAADLLRRARLRYRERLRVGRPTGGRAWAAIGSLPPELARFAMPHSPAEYRLAQLPPRIVGSLEGILDDDERILAWVRRPGMPEAGLFEALRRGGRRIDRREAVLLLTDRQLVWVVDHAEPGRYLVEWGVDVELVPLERLVGVRAQAVRDAIQLTVETDAGGAARGRSYDLPIEAAAEIEVTVALLERFTPAGAAGRLVRRYALEARPPGLEEADRFRQREVAVAFHERARALGEVLGFLFSPRRPGTREPSALAVFEWGVAVLTPDGVVRAPATDVAALTLTLSPLVGRLALVPGPTVTYPAPFSGTGAAVTRLLRRAVANARPTLSR